MCRNAAAVDASLRLPGHPLSVRTRVVTPDSVLVTWQAPVDGGPVGGYMIGYGEGVPDVNWQYLEAHRRNVTIKNLSRYQCSGSSTSVILLTRRVQTFTVCWQ